MNAQRQTFETEISALGLSPEQTQGVLAAFDAATGFQPLSRAKLLADADPTDVYSTRSGSVKSPDSAIECGIMDDLYPPW